MVDVYQLINVVIFVYNVLMDPMKQIAVRRKIEILEGIFFLFIARPNCTFAQFRCANGRCIPSSWVCGK